MKKKRCFICLFFLVVSQVLHASYNLGYVDGFYYDAGNRYSNEVQLIYSSIYKTYSGDLQIPETITAKGGLVYRVISIGQGAFEDCKGFTGTLTIPNSIRTIGYGAFKGCSGFTGSLTIPNSVTSIGGYAFYECSGFTGSLIIPNSVTSIGDAAFLRCSGLSGSLTIPNSVTSIGEEAFYECSGLSGSLTIPNSVTSIGQFAFYGCNGLENVYSNILNPFPINKFTFPFSATLHIPKGTKSAYQQCSGWTDIFSKIVDDLYNPNLPVTTYSLSVKAVGSGSATYNGETTREGQNTFILDEGTYITITFTPDNGYRIKSLKVNGSNVTASTSYATTINADTSIEVEFEAIPPTTYTLSIKAMGNGSASYGGESIRGTTKSYTVNEGTSATISFTPDNGYRIKSLKVNGSNVTASTSYTTTINADTSIEVEFEAIPPTTYTLSIKAIGNGSASYGGENTRGTTKSYTVNEGTSATISFTPDNGYRIKSLKVNGSNVTASTSYTTTINADTSIEVEFEAIPPTTYTLSIKAIGNGSASYGGESIRGATKSYTVNEGTSVSISFTPDNGYRIKSLKVNGSNVTASTSYTTTINADTSIEVEFEAIPPTTYTLSIKAIGNGSASYGGESIRGTTKSYTVNEGTSATISFTSDNGYRIKSLKVNGSNVTASTSYTTTINADTSIEVEFEAIPPTTYTLSIKATGNGYVSYGGESVRGATKSYTVNEGTSATISFVPDNGYRIKSLKVNGSNVTASTSYTTTISANTSIEVEFEVIPPTTYTLSIKATGNGSASYSGTSIKGKTSTFTVNEGTNATISFTPDTGYRIKSLKVNSKDVTSSISNNKYTVTVNSDTSVEVVFEAIPATTYTLSIKATGNGSASYSGTSIKGKTSTFTVNEGTIATITFSPDTGYRIKSLKVNSKDVTSSVSSDKYTVTVNSDTSVEVVFEAIPATTYTLSIKATGNGSASYDGNIIKGKTSTFTVNEGTSATITFISEDGYRIKSLKVNGTAVTATNSYTFTVNKDVSVEVEFEAIPITTYTLSIKATGNGSASYSGESIRNTTKSYSLNSGTTAIIAFTPDNGYRIKDVEVNGKSVNLNSNNSYTLTVNTNTTVEVEYEEIPSTLASYTLTIVSSGNGAASYGGETIRQSSKSYTIDEGTYATITFTPDEGCRIKDVEVNGASVSLDNNSYSFKMSKDITVDVEFEELPSMTYNLSISATGNGSVIYNGESIRETTQSYTIYEGSNVNLSFNPDNDKKLLSVLINGESVDVISDSYTISNVNSDVNVVVTFEGTVNYDIITIDGINYQVISYDDHLLKLDGCDDVLTLDVPETINYQGEEWNIIGITNDALMTNESIAAIIWNPEVLFTAKVTNPNLLLYVKDEAYAPSSIKNVVVNGYAKSISLTDAQTGNNFHCPISFTAGSVVYSHSYSMKTGMNESRGWETVALPFDVQEFSHSSRGEIIPFAKWSEGTDMKPFWLFELSGDGFVEAEEVKAYTPYIISMPNNELYENEYKLSGRVTFSSKNVEISNSEDYLTQTYGGKTFIPNYIEKQANDGYYALNVNNDYAINEGGSNEGSKFILNLRKIHPFEAYMTSTSNARAFEVFEDMKTVIRGVEEITLSQKKVKVYDLSGKLLKVGTSLDAIKQELPAGVYIVNNQKIMVK